MGKADMRICRLTAYDLVRGTAGPSGPRIETAISQVTAKSCRTDSAAGCSPKRDPSEMRTKEYLATRCGFYR